MKEAKMTAQKCRGNRWNCTEFLEKPDFCNRNDKQ